MNRRGFLQGIVGAAAGALILPPTLAENTEAARRYWVLDRTMTGLVYPPFRLIVDRTAGNGRHVQAAYAIYDDGHELDVVIDGSPASWTLSAPVWDGGAALRSVRFTKAPSDNTTFSVSNVAV